MAMQVESLEVLEKAHAPPELARAIVRAIEIETTAGKHDLATKHDLLVLGTELRGEMKSLGTELRGEMKSLAAELRGEMKSLATELRAEMKSLATELQTEMKTLATKGELADLKAELHRAVSSSTRQMYLAVLSQTAVMLGFGYFLVTQLR